MTDFKGRNLIFNKRWAHNDTFNTCLSENTQHYIFNEGKGRTIDELKIRIVCLQLFLSRWGIEATFKQGAQGDRVDAALKGLEHAIGVCDLKNKFTNKEFQQMIKPLGAWNEIDLHEISWSWEGFGTLQWCLGILDSIPEPYNTFQKGPLFQNTTIQPNKPETIIQFLENTNFNPQTPEEINNMLAKKELWHWRGQAQSLLNLKKLKNEVFKSEPAEDEAEIMDFEQLPIALQTMIDKLPKAIKSTTELAKERNLLEETIDGDFAVPNINGKLIPYGQLEESLTDDLFKSAEVRLHALTYLMGNLEWDEEVSKLGDDNRNLSTLPKVWSPEEKE